MLARRVVCILIALSLVAQYCIYFADSDGLSWSTVQNEDIYQLDFLAGAFMFMMKFSLALNLALYCTLRQIRILANSKHLPVLAVISMASFMIFTFKVGSRTDTLALFLGIAVFEAGRIRFTARRIVAVGVIVCTLYAYLSVLGNHRTEQSGVDTDRLTRILVSDYYAPAHMLFAAVAYQYIDPEEVITSNAANTLVLMHHPYLQATVTDLFLPGVATRSQGFAFYNFTEGYLFAGFSGFLYNGVVLGFLMALWRSCATTNSEKLNHFLLAIMGSMVIGLIRGQCSYFIKIMYTFIIPGAVVYLALNGMRLRLWVRQKA